MSQQLSIVALLDTAAAVASCELEGNIYLFDNGKWFGSTGLGTGDLVTKIDATRTHTQVDSQVLNWLPYAIEAPVRSLPKSFFLDNASALDADRGEDGNGPETDPPKLKFPDSEGLTEGNSLYSIPPKVTGITGEAVDRGVIFPGEYGSPDPAPHQSGWYWSAAVNTNMIGLFSYTMHFEIGYLSVTDADEGEYEHVSVALTHDASLNIEIDYLENGFSRGPTVLPMR